MNRVLHCEGAAFVVTRRGPQAVKLRLVRAGEQQWLQAVAEAEQLGAQGLVLQRSRVRELRLVRSVEKQLLGPQEVAQLCL